MDDEEAACLNNYACDYHEGDAYRERVMNVEQYFDFIQSKDFDEMAAEYVASMDEYYDSQGSLEADEVDEANMAESKQDDKYFLAYEQENVQVEQGVEDGDLLDYEDAEASGSFDYEDAEASDLLDYNDAAASDPLGYDDAQTTNPFSCDDVAASDLLGYDDAQTDDPLAYLASRQGDEETSTQASANRAPPKAPAERCTQERSAGFTAPDFAEALGARFTLVTIKDILRHYGLKVSGNRDEAIGRLAEELYMSFRMGRMEEYNEMVDFINGIPATSPRIFGHAVLLPKHASPFTCTLVERACRAHEFRITSLGTERYRLERVLSSPVYFPLVPDAMDGKYTLTFHYRKTRQQPGTRRLAVALYMARIYAIKENPVEGSVAHRVSSGHLIATVAVNSVVLPLEKLCGEVGPLVLPESYLRDGTNTVAIQISKKGFPYYMQVVEAWHDQSKVPVIPAAKVKRSFLAKLKQDEVSATSFQLSLCCPLSLVRLKAPIRFDSCTHLQCWELGSWLDYSKASGSSTPPCPICGKAGQPDNASIVVCGYVLEVLSQVDEAVAKVEVSVENGLAWSAHRRRPAAEKPRQIDEQIWVDLTDDDTVYDTPWLPPVCVKKDPGVPYGHPKKAAYPPKKRWAHELAVTDEALATDSRLLAYLIREVLQRQSAGRTAEDPIEID